MGDNRAHIRISFTMHGRTENSDMWINYYPEHFGEFYIDKRIMEFLDYAPRSCRVKAAEDEMKKATGYGLVEE